MLLYILSSPELLGNFNVLIKPQPFKYAGRLLRKIGGIPATKVDDKNGGSVKRIAKELEKKPEGSVLLISPKGSIVKREWRTGYYYLAKELGVPLMTVGLDFEKKCVYASQRISSDLPEPEVREFLQKELANIVPLVSDQEVVEIRSHDPSKVGVVKSWPSAVREIFLYTLCMITLLQVCS